MPIALDTALATTFTAGYRTSLPLEWRYGDGLYAAERLTLEPRVRGWPDSEFGVGGDLAVTLARLRKGAPGTLEVGDARVLANVSTDAQALLKAVEHSEYEETVALYRGPFLEGVGFEDLGGELEKGKVSGRRQTRRSRL